MTPPAVLRSARLCLRPPVVADAPALFDAYTQDAEVARYTTWSAHRSLDETRQFLERHLEARAAGKLYSWLITTVEDGRPVGMIDSRLDGFRAEIGYVLTRALWGRGLMTEAAETVVTHVLAEPGMQRVWATVDLENVASQRVLQKIGMEREGILRRWLIAPTLGPLPRDVYSFSRVKEASP